jgi:hypothetical protein
MFELSRLIARESEFRPSPDKSEARKGFFRRLHREKTRNRGRLLLVTFLGEARKVTRRQAKRVGEM